MTGNLSPCTWARATSVITATTRWASLSENTFFFSSRNLLYLSVSCVSLQNNLSPQNYTHNLILGLDMLYSQVTFFIGSFITDIYHHISNCLLHQWFMFLCHFCSFNGQLQVPRALVNVVELMQLDPVKTVTKTTIGCSFFSRYLSVFKGPYYGHFNI